MIQMWVTVGGLGAAALCDWKNHKIPNVITFSMIVLGLVLNIQSYGVPGLQYSLFGLGIGLLLLLIPFAAGGVGAGDVKLLAAVGSLLGPTLVVQAFLASAVFGGLFSIWVVIRQRALKKTLEGMKNRILYFLLTRRFPGEGRGEGPERSLSIPYAFAIGCGTLFTLFLL